MFQVLKNVYGSRPLAARMGMICAGGVLSVSLLWSINTYRQHLRDAEQTFDESAVAALHMTQMALAQSEDIEASELLRSFFQFEYKRQRLDRVAIIDSQSVIMAHNRDLEHMPPDFALDRASLHAHLADVQARDMTTDNNMELQRFEGFARLVPPTSDRPLWLYVSRSATSLSSEAWQEAVDVFKVGCVLALAAGVIAYLCFARMMAAPLKELEEKVAEQGLASDLDSEKLGELRQLAKALEQATESLLSQEADKRAQISAQLEEIDEASEIQTQLLQVMVKDLRTSMSAILGHAELLMTGDPKPAERVNYIRAIQQDARHIWRIAHELQVLLRQPEDAVENEDRVSLPISELRLVIEQLMKSQPSPLHLEDPGLARVRHDASGSMEYARTKKIIEVEKDAVIRKLSGSILIAGPHDENCSSLLDELHELGIDAVLVPDVNAVDSELRQGNYDSVIINLCKGGRGSVQLFKDIQQRAADLPLIAMLPSSLRGEGDKFISIGCQDYIYMPINRRGLLAVLGKFINFQEVED